MFSNVNDAQHHYNLMMAMRRRHKKELIKAHARGMAEAYEDAAKVANEKFYPHTFASENSDEYIEQWNIGRSIAASIRQRAKERKP